MNNRKYTDTFSGKVKSNRHTRFLKQKRKDIRAIAECSRAYVSGIEWSESYREFILPDADRRMNEFRRYQPGKRAYPKRYYRWRYAPYLRKNCNRRFRKQKRDFLGKSNAYRHCTEFWWELT